jgi:hypothetical protein
VSLLDRKLLRDIAAMRGQVITIALVVAAGVAVFVASVSTYDSLQSARDRLYDSARFPQVFVTLRRAPLSIVTQLNEIAGVAAVEPRIVRDVIVDWPSSVLPVSARMVSLVHAGDEPLARLTPARRRSLATRVVPRSTRLSRRRMRQRQARTFASSSMAVCRAFTSLASLCRRSTFTP